MMVSDIRIDEYDYPLPDERIASHPSAERDGCLLLVERPGEEPTACCFRDLPSLLPEDALLVCNNTRVINARLRFRKGNDGEGALIEIFCLEPSDPSDYAVSFASTRSCSWICFVGNSKRWKDTPLTSTVDIDGKSLTLTAVRKSKEGNTSVVEFLWDNPVVTFSSIISAIGEIPIPPYLNRPTDEADSADYQTVFSRIEGSVAAPTAGLHFTPAVLSGIEARGIPRRELTLHVGAGTFQPVKSDTIGAHLMHSEFIAVPRTLIAELADTGRRVVAVGTTSVRTLESLYHFGCLAWQGKDCTELPQWYPYSADHPALPVKEALGALLRKLDEAGEDVFVASTRLMIAPGYHYRVVKGMVTNFHQPRSTLLLLVSAFLEEDPRRQSWRSLYDFALADPRFRFLSYGDACLLL